MTPRSLLGCCFFKLLHLRSFTGVTIIMVDPYCAMALKPATLFHSFLNYTVGNANMAEEEKGK